MTRGVSFAASVAALIACSSASLPSSETAEGAAAITDLPGEAILRDAATACPAPFDDPAHAPVAGDNTGFTAGGQTRRFGR